MIELLIPVLASFGLLFAMSEGQLLDAAQDVKIAWFHKLINCPICLAFWTGILFSITQGRILSALFVAFAAAGGAWIVLEVLGNE